MNKVMLMGRLTADPELKTTPAGKSVTMFSLAVPRRYQKDETDFINCEAWEKTAEFICQWFRKGRMLAVEGRLQLDRWQDSGGHNKSRIKVVVEAAEFTGEKSDRNDGGYPYSGGSRAGYRSARTPAETGDIDTGSGAPIGEDYDFSDDFEDLEGFEDDLPF